MYRLAGTDYATLPIAALAYAQAALPDPTVVEPHERPSAAAEDLEAYYYCQEVQAGVYEVPDSVEVDRWRKLCRLAIAAVIYAHREGRRVTGRDVEVMT